MPPLPIRKHCEACKKEIKVQKVIAWRKNNKEIVELWRKCYLLRLKLADVQLKIDWFQQKYPDYDIRKSRAMYDYWLCKADKLAHRLNKLANVL